MSWMKCKDCDHPVNTDDHPEAFVDVGNQKGLEDWICVCSDCRYIREMRQDLDDHVQMMAEQEAEANER
jgi:hypothetical protein